MYIYVYRKFVNSSTRASDCKSIVLEYAKSLSDVKKHSRLVFCAFIMNVFNSLYLLDLFSLVLRNVLCNIVVLFYFIEVKLLEVFLVYCC